MANQLTEKLVLDSSNFDKNIGNVIKKVEELKNKGKTVGGGFNSSFGKMITKATGFNGSMGSLVGVVGKFSGALGVAISAGELFNRMMDQSQTLGDDVTKVQNQASEAVNYFASSMASADFGGFLEGLRNIISLAGDAADAMDRAASIAIRFGWTNKSQVSAYNKAMAEARNPENSKEERLKYLEEAKKISEQITKNETTKSKADIDAAFITIRTELGKVKYNGRHVDTSKLTNKDIRELFDVSNFERNEQIHNNMQAALDGVVLTNTKYGAHGAHLAKADQEKFSKSNKMLAIYAANEINDNSDSPLGQALQMIGAADEMLANQAERDAQIGKLGKRINNNASKVTNGTTKPTKGGGGGSTEIDYAVNSVGWLEKEIQKLQKEIKFQVDATEIEKLQNKIKELQKQLDALLNHRHYLSINADLSGMTPTFSTAKGFDEIKKIKLEDDVKPMNLQEQYKHWTDIANNVFENYDIGAIASDRATELIKEINKNLQSLGLKPIKLDIITDKQKLFDDIQEGANSLLNGFGAIDSVVSNITSLAEAIHHGADAWQIFMGVLETGVGIINSVSSVLQTVNALQEMFGTTALSAASAKAAAGATEVATSEAVTTANVTEAGTEAVKQGAKMPFPLNLVAIAASVAAVLAALAAVGAFANGGIVGGNSYSGDRLFARVNSGEAILNQNQQKHLFTLLDGNHGNVVGGNVNFVIKGKDLHGCLANYDNQMSKVR